MLIHYLSGGTSEWRLARHHLPDDHAQRVKIRANVHTGSPDLLRAGKSGCPDERAMSNVRFAGSRRFDQAEIDDLDREVWTARQHQVGWLQVSVHQPLALGERHCAGHLLDYRQRKEYRQRSIATHTRLQCFPLDKFHGVEALAVAFAHPVVKNGRDVRMPKPRRGAGFAQEAFPRVRAPGNASVDHFQRHGVTQGRIEGTVGYPHSASAQLGKTAVVAPHNLVMIKTALVEQVL